MFKRFALAAALLGFAALLPSHGTASLRRSLSPRSSLRPLCRRSFQPRARPRRIVLRTL